MNANKSRLIGIVLISLALSVILFPFLDIETASDAVSILYGVLSVLFSIGMSMVCALSVDKVGNHSYYQNIKNNSIRVRDTALCLFVIDSIGCGGAAVSNFSHQFNPWMGISIDLFAAVLSSISIIYFALNFIAIQNLDWEIKDRVRGEK